MDHLCVAVIRLESLLYQLEMTEGHTFAWSLRDAVTHTAVCDCGQSVVLRRVAVPQSTRFRGRH